MSTPHTPGPWRVRCIAGLPGFVEAPRLDPSHPHDIEVLGEDDAHYPTRDADLELVAKAPEMYAALKLIAGSDGFRDGTFVLELQQIARSVLATLEGK